MVSVTWDSTGLHLLGRDISIQQRLKKIGTEELELLSESWATILVIPIYGGIFSLVLYTLFLSGIIDGHMFPNFSIAQFSKYPTTDDVVGFLTKTYPSQGSDIAKLIFWSFVAGFSERFVPQIIHKVSSSAEKGGD